MKTILIATQKPFAPVAINKISDIFKQAGYQIELLESYSSKADFEKAIEKADAVIIRSDIVDASLLQKATNLKIIVRAGAGYDNVDTEAAKKRGVVVMNTPGQNSNAVAELAIGLMIYGLREFYTGRPGGELRGRTLGLHGYGYVARNVHRIARGLGMDVKVYTHFSRSQAISEGLEITGSLEELYSVSDIVSIHVPARGIHIKSVSMDVLSHLKKNAILINTARKEVINENDLCKFLEERTDVKFLADITPDCASVFEEKFKGRYYFTPKKMGAQTEEANINAGVAAAEQIVSYFEKGDETFRVNK